MPSQNTEKMKVKIISGAVARGQKVCVYGPEGVGKTSFAALFPTPLFLDLERGTCGYEVDRIYAQTIGQVEEALDSLGGGGSGYQTLVVDTVDALWQLMGRQVACAKGVKNVDEVAYGKGVPIVADVLLRFMDRLDALAVGGMHVVILAHTEVKKFEDAEAAAAYDRYIFRIQKQSANVVMERMDSVLFANFDAKAVRDASGKVRGVGGRERVLHTVHTASHDGKNRLGLPEKMPLSRETVERLLRGPAKHPWDAIVKGFSDEQIAGFLVQAGYLAEGRNWREVSVEVLQRGLASPERLRAALESYSGRLSVA